MYVTMWHVGTYIVQICMHYNYEPQIKEEASVNRQERYGARIS